MNAENLWAEFCQKKNIDINTPYEAWAFCGGGEEGDKLADLVLAGKKFATASVYDEYAFEDAHGAWRNTPDNEASRKTIIANNGQYIEPYHK